MTKHLVSLKRIFTGYTHGKAQTEEFQTKVIILITVVAMPTTAIFAVINYQYAHIWLAGIELFTLVLLLPCLLLLRNIKHLPMIRRLLMIDATIIFAALFVDGGISQDGMTWPLIYPFFAFLMMGLPMAWFWILGFIAILTAFSTAHYVGLFPVLIYSDEALLFFPATFLFFTIVASIFELQLDRLHIRHIRIIAELEELQSSLKSKIRQRTKALQHANDKLLNEIEQHRETANALQESEERFYQAQKMESVGTLVGGIAHDFNNMLSGINANLFMIKRNLVTSPEVDERIDDIKQLVSSAADMIRQLLTFARKDNVEYKIFNLKPFIGEAYKLATVSISSDISLTRRLPEEDIWINANATQLQQVLMNLINNARDAVKGRDSPSISVEVDAWTPDEPFMKRHPELHAERYARITVSDNGSGISEELQTRIFEPFFTTKESGRGTGLGLAMCYGAIQGHGGTIEVESETDKGTTFHILLPEYIEADDGFHKTTLRNIEFGHGESILIADDDPMLRRLLHESLTDIGYHVILASNGKEAVAQFSRYKDEIKLVILEVVMPIMGGVVAAQMMRETKADVPVIFVSGYDPEDTLDGKNLPSQGDFILDKPFTMDELSRAVHKQLNQ